MEQKYYQGLGYYLQAAISDFRREVGDMIKFTQFYGHSPGGERNLLNPEI